MNAEVFFFWLYRSKNILAYGLIFFLPVCTNAQDTLFYGRDQPVLDIGKYALIYEDKKDSLTIEQIKALPDAAFQKSKKSVMNFGNSISSIGIKLYIKNNSNEPLYLSFENNELQNIEVLTVDESGQQTLQQGGNLAPFSNRFFQRGNAVLKIGQNPSLVCLRVRTHSSFYLPITLSSLQPMVNQSLKLDIFKGLTLGIMLAMLFYNLFIFFIVRDRLYLYYCLYVAAGIYTYSHLNGLWFFAWSDFPFFNRFLGIQLFAVSAAIFSFKFLNTRLLVPGLHRFMLYIVAVILVLIPIEYLDIQPFTNNFLQILIAASIFVLFASGVLAYRNGNKSAQYYVIAWVFFLSGSVITLLNLIGLLPYNFWTFNASLIGACLENMFLSFALANRINIYRMESAEAQALAIKRLEENERLVREQNKVLEERVHDRTNELERSLDVLKATQNQLIQSEKLASLGELTAGIAHEIQNPLNFVNNFSELSVDLVKDLKEELEKPDVDKEYVQDLFNDLESNQEKIHHHGKRASSIVIGMLEHSRASTGKKEPIDLNKLADEYLRLSYHGLRAKDKSFNANFVTTLQDSIPKTLVIPQDMGRVFLNLFNNAFYSVNEKKKKIAENIATQPPPVHPPTYEPSVTVSTQLIDNQIVVKVRDNGTGIPDSVREKVFQPFFTTKPTGQGTGLGLSLSYEIITKGHGGTLDVETELGDFTEFIIKLPVTLPQ